MSKAKHTPGPWRVAAPPDKVCTDYRDEDGSMLNTNWVQGGHPKTIVTCEHRGWMADGEEFANAQLIAAAPELLSELRYLIDWLEENRRSIEGMFLMDELLADPRSAIAKAEGRS